MLRVSLVGQTLDEKYRIERELGKGGMGAVYLATHVGTERAVAVKVIAPEFMRRAEFVERFRREARAAGRLRHPNVVDVTDFGIAETEWGNMAYLTMEYLDGCTLGEILEEEKKLPLSWTLDILEQTCAAVEEAHRQGIIHRDLKPDNIWLEPNASGGYTVKVLDFGIAKLEEPMHRDDANENYHSSSIHLTLPPESENQTLAFSTDSNGDDNSNENQSKSFVDQTSSGKTSNQETLILPAAQNNFSESSTLAQNQAPSATENKTAIFAGVRRTTVDNAALTMHSSRAPENVRENAETKILEAPTTNNAATAGAATTAALTQIGAVLGTPLYMSPEQCRGERLDARADIYSLGVIAYQMLSGATPFTGSYTEVMAAHKNNEPPKLENKKVSSKVKRVISTALAKEPNNRPPTALAFASKLQADSEGISGLLQRALVIYSERLPTFLWLSFLISLPLFILTLTGIALRLLSFGELIPSFVVAILSACIGLGSLFTGIFFNSILIGATTWVVTQALAAPLRPISWRQALAVVWDKWRSFAGTVTITTLFSFLGYVLCLIPGLILSVRYHLVAPIVMMENLRGRAALKRSTQLVKRSLGTVVAAYFFQFAFPLIVAALIGFFVSSVLKSNEIFINKSGQGNFSITIDDNNKKAGTPQITINDDLRQVEDEAAATANPGQENTADEAAGADNAKPKKKRGLFPVLYEALFQIVLFPTMVILSSLTSIISALLYLKTRQAGGESMTGLLTQFGETERPQKRWQLRLNQKFEQSSRQTTNRNT